VLGVNNDTNQNIYKYDKQIITKTINEITNNISVETFTLTLNFDLYDVL